MRFSIPTIATFLAYVLAAPVAAPDVSAPAHGNGFVTIPLSRKPAPPPSKIPDFAAGSPLTKELVNAVNAYFVDVEIGGQKQTASLDTGSPFLWVWYTKSEACTTDYATQCQQDGAYNPALSTHSNDTQTTFSVQYGKGYDQGEYFTDTAAIGAAVVPKLKFGVNYGYPGDGGFSPIFGVGPNDSADSNFAGLLKSNGVIKRNVYGLSLAEATDKTTSEISFGAINTGRFDGTLKGLSIVNDGQDHYTVEGSGKFGSRTLFTDQNVVFDSGTSLTLLQSDAFSEFLGGLDDLGITYHDEGGALYSMDCADAGKISINYNFAGKNIVVAGEDLTIQASLIDTSYSDSSRCIIGVQDGDDMNLFGDTFLRAVYTVYDNDNQLVYVAQAAHGKANNYVVITDAIPQ